MHAYNTFEKPDVVKEEDFISYKITEKGIEFELPACSVIRFRVK